MESSKSQPRSLKPNEAMQEVRRVERKASQMAEIERELVRKDTFRKIS